MRPPGRSGDEDRSATDRLRVLIDKALGDRQLSPANRARLDRAMSELGRIEDRGRDVIDSIRSGADTDPDPAGSGGDVGARTERIRAAIAGMLDDRTLTATDRARLGRAVAELGKIDLGDVELGDLIAPGTRPRPGEGDIGDFVARPISPQVIVRAVDDAIARPVLGKDQLLFVADNVIGAIRKTVPDALPSRPIATGLQGADLPLAPKALAGLVRIAAARRPDGPSGGARDDGAILWDDGSSQILIQGGKLRTEIGDGIVRIVIPVETDAGATEMTVPFAVGSEKRVTGLIAAAPDRPAGDPLIAEIWGDSLIAFAYGALLDVADSLAGASGRDTDNDRLVARGVSVQGGAFVIQSQAAFRYKRSGP